MTDVSTSTLPDRPWDAPRWFREVASNVTAMLLRLYGAHQLDVVEDAVQDAFVAAVRTWPLAGLPSNPTGWLLHAARNRVRDAHRRRKHEVDAPLAIAGATAPRDEDVLELTPLADDQVTLLFACCHPALSTESRVALTLKTVAQLSVEEIARALHADTRAVAQRLVRAKKTLRDTRATWRMPIASELSARLDDVLAVSYAMFSEGHSATEGDVLVRTDLCHEAIRCLECLVAWPDTATPDSQALLALCCFAAARVPTRAGDVVWRSLAEQDRSRWDRALLSRGLRALDRAASGTHISRYHIEAEIAALHSFAPSYAETPWPTIVHAYDRLLEIVPSRAAALARAIALAESGDEQRAWESLEQMAHAAPVAQWANWHAARAEIAERRGDIATAVAAMEHALTCTLPAPAQRYLQQRVSVLRESLLGDVAPRAPHISASPNRKE